MADVKTLTINGASYTIVDEAAQNAASTAQTSADTHAARTDNPHGVTISQIGAAPAGYGLGEYIASYDFIADANTATNTGKYRVSSGSTNGVSYTGILDVDGYTETYVKQKLYAATRGYVLERTIIDGVVREWEWPNPPMVLGVEYRTTERCEDLPVYAKRIAYTVSETIGNDTGNTDTLIAHGISNFSSLVRVFGRNGSYPLPLLNSSGGSCSINQVSVSAIILRNYKNITSAGGTLYFDLYYTKTS